ncbi:MAG: PAS domain S-box protein [Bacteroidales bacterium]|nr:PAS domain S-box protein [Bacteroidales bacterium]
MIFLPFLHFFSFIASAALAVFIFYRDTRSLLNRMSAFLMICYSLWNFGDVIVHNPDRSINIELVIIMQNIASFGWISFASVFLSFALAFTKNQNIVRKKWFLLPVVLLPALFIYLQLTNNLSVNPVRQPYGWSLDWSDSVWTYLFFSYYLIFTLLSVSIILVFCRRLKDSNEKKLSKIVVVISMVGILAGTLMDVVIQNMGIYRIPPLTNLMVFIFGSGILYAIFKYRFLTITPTIAAESIVSAMDEFLILLDQEGVILNVNKATLATLQYKRADLEGKSITAVLPQNDSVADLYAKIIEKKSFTNREGSFRAGNGQNIPVIFSSSPVRDNLGSVIGSVLIARDITERKKAELALNESNEVYRNLIEKMPDGVYKTSHDGQVIEVNPAMLKILGFSSKEELMGISIGKELYFDPMDRERLTIEGIDKDLISYRLRKKDGNEVWVEDHGWYTYSDSGEILFHEGIIRDISERKQAEKELIIAKEKAEESDRLKSAFLANMSHEIRTPMNGILGFADLLKNPNLTGEDQKNYIEIIEKSGERMLSIINDIIDISKIEAGLMKADIRESNINEQIEYVYYFFKPEVEAKGMKLYYSNSLMADESVIKTDPEKVFAILTNLVKNAIKYTKEGSIEFGYEIVQSDQRLMMRFFVRDTGIGIPKDRQAMVFERFVQADVSGKNAYQGAGLGLSITRAYVDMLGGKIWVESDAGSGSVFYFTLPYIVAGRKPVVADNTAALEKPEAEMKKLKVLIAEDDETSKKLVYTFVREFSQEILEARTGNEVIDLFHDNPGIDLILMDIQMPGLNGYEATRKIRQENKDVIIIAQTAFAQAGDREKSIEAGCNDYISKPISKEKLMALIHKHFNPHNNKSFGEDPVCQIKTKK